MGTASTMGLLAEALGTVIPGLAGTPAPDSRLLEGAMTPVGWRSSWQPRADGRPPC